MHIGKLTGTLLIFGGTYSNLQATQAVKTLADSLNIPPENCICTGDIVAYCAQPQTTTQLIREWGAHCLMGNCEESFATEADDCGCGFTEGSSCDVLSAQWFQYANRELTSHERQWFSSLPRTIDFNYYDTACQVVHGSISSINQFIFPSTDADILDKELGLSDADIIIAGHSGIPFTQQTSTKANPLQQRIWHNAGAIGMPANDGTSRTWCSIFTVDNTSTTLQIEHRALDYDDLAAHKDMLAAGMNNGYADALLSGLWPSMDVLPDTEKKQQGNPLAIEKFSIALDTFL